MSYVIDENILLNATHGKKADNETPALEEKQFVYGIIRDKSHIFVNEKILGKIRKLPEKISNGYKREFLDNHIMPMYLKLLSDSTRVTVVQGISTGFKGVKDCDHEFVGVALQSKGVLVTADVKLKEAIAKDDSVSECTCMTVEEIIDS